MNSRRFSGRMDLLAAAFALLTRIAHLLGYLLGSRTELYYWPVLASRKFESAAQAILRGSAETGPFVYASPLYRYLILPFYAAGTDRLGLFIFQGLLGVVTAWLLYRMALKAGASPWFALAASVIWSLYAPALFFEFTILPVSILTAAVTALALITASSKQKYGRPSSMGGLAGLAAGLRPPFLLMLALPMWKWLRCRSWKKLMTALAVLAVPLLFLSFMQLSMGGGFYPFPRTAGCNLVLGHSSQSTGYGPPIPSLGLVETGQGDIHQVAARVAAERGYTDPAEADAYWMRTALSWIAEHPVEELRLMAVKIGGFFGAKPFDTYYEVGRVSSFNPVLKFAFVPRLLISVLFLTGLIPFLLKGKNRLALLMAPAIAFASSVIFVHSERYFLPVLPAMLAAAASGWGVLTEEIRKKSLKYLICGVLGLLLLLPAVFYPVPSVPEGMYLGSLALRADLMGNQQLALELFERSALTAREGSTVWVQAHREAARLSGSLGLQDRARQHLRILHNFGVAH